VKEQQHAGVPLRRVHAVKEAVGTSAPSLDPTDQKQAGNDKREEN
jgi:hypothetical protein